MTTPWKLGAGVLALTAFGCGNSSDASLPSAWPAASTASPSASHVKSAWPAESTVTPAASASAMTSGTPVVCRGEAIILLLDRSGSMTGLPMQSTKDAAKAVAKAMPAGSCLQVTFFDSAVTDAVALGPVDAASAAVQIDAVTARGGTEFVAPLESGVRSVRRIQGVTDKRVIFLSDGQAPSASVLETVAKLREAGATVSTIALGSSADGTLLKKMADSGKGRFYAVTDPSVLEKILLGEIQTP